MSLEVQELIAEGKEIVKISPTIRKEPSLQEEIADPEFLFGFQKQYHEYLNQLSLIRQKKLEVLDKVREEGLVVDARLDHLGRLETNKKRNLFGSGNF